MPRLADCLPVRRADTAVRALRLDDVARFHEYRSDGQLARYQTWEAMSEEHALAFLQATAKVTDLIAGDWVQLGITEAATDALVGDIGLFLSSDARASEVGFTLCRAGQGRGHATRAVQIAVELLLRCSQAEFTRAVTDARNVASIGVLERAGFALAHEQRAIFKGEACTELVYIRPR